MFPTYVIEIGDEQAGLVVLEGRKFRFYAAEPYLARLEERTFSSVAEATRAVREIFSVRPRPSPVGRPDVRPA